MELPSLAPDRAGHLFSIAREALANVVKHSGSATAYVRVMGLPGRVVVEVGDDGRGFDPDGRHPDHFGLKSMRSRAAEIGGQLTISSAPGQGTVVRAEAPAGDG
jgi:signal transduction histidine kinase